MADHAKTRAKFDTEPFKKYTGRGYIEVRPYMTGEIEAGLEISHAPDVDPEVDLGYVARRSS